MAGGRQRRKRRLREARKAATSAAVATHIFSLPDDILRLIFLRLRSLATLVRAACACRAWRRAVASSPAFRRRFRTLHPVPLLGVFADSEHSGLTRMFSVTGHVPSATDGLDDPTWEMTGLPVFFAAAQRHADSDVLAVLRGGDFVLTPLIADHDDDAPLRWRVIDCRDGYLLLLPSLDAIQFATVNPLARQRPDYIDISDVDVVAAEEHRGQFVSLDVHMLPSDEDLMSFRLVWLFHDESRVRAAVFSSEDWEWRVLPWVEVVAPREEEDDNGGEWLDFGTQATGLVCWGFKKQQRMLTLDTKTMEFSVWELPQRLNPEDFWLRHSLTVDGAEKWVLDDILGYSEEPELLNNVGTPDVVAIRDGFVYLVASEAVLSLCLKTWKLEKLFPRNFGEYFYPYFMSWPCSLVGSYGKFAALKDQDVATNDA
ncbi:unnamed protein product [Urochloa decumbens]|uniref:F-box domain-containing protein n=1 Tax=Urochloa decumbens TaxID=240449 RepID=A0ABC8Z540_9POAL